MASEFDESDFVDSEFQSTKHAPYATPAAGGNRPPTREELDGKVGDAQQKIAELKRAQEELERERAALEEARRRQMEFHTGREEMINHLARGVGILEEAEFSARRDAEQMTKTLGDLRDALTKVQAIQDETWTKETWNIELTRALTILENARMEWNGARLKWPKLDGALANPETGAGTPGQNLLNTQDFRQLCKLGLALTWPLVLIALLALGVFATILARK
jgi:hypothetical protein